MAQFEYNDLNKFYVSVGVFLIGLTFLLPWLFLRESFDLLVTVGNLADYTKEAQKIIHQRQTIVGLFSLVIPIISIISLTVGIYLSYKGIKGWRKLQTLIEEREKLTNQKLSIEISSLSKEDKIEKVNKEVKLFRKENVSIEKSGEVDFQKSFRENYIYNEKKFYDIIEKFLNKQYKIYRDFRIDNNEYDLLLKSPLLMDKDIIIEIKYSESRVGQTYLLSCVNQLKNSLKYYKEKVKSNTQGIVVFLLTQKALSEKTNNPNAVYDNTLNLFEYENKNLRGGDLRITYFEIDKLDSYTYTEILQILKI